jgi:hypothetical protein
MRTEWVALTTHSVLIAWVTYGDLFDEDSKPTLLAFAGLGLRIFIVTAPVSLVLGILVTGDALLRHAPPGLGLFVFLVFLTSVVAEFLILGILGLVALFQLIYVLHTPDDDENI